MKTVDIFIDGACSGNPGPGGWGAILCYGGHSREISGSESRTTNNRMEMRAAIASLLMIKETCIVHVHTDSKYLQEGMTQYIHKWQENGWRNSNGQPVKNQDLWEALLEACRIHQVTWHWVQGHNGNVRNERADCLARMAIQKANRSV
ncbi:MAG TPA: ribonuclease HI [Syntrophobacteraceae bacterium]|nr:ribonuclease HI [Syntrophobacteraceae bacterium]